MQDKDRSAEDLISWQFEVEPDLQVVYRVLAPNEDNAGEPIKLVAVDAASVSTGTFEAFGFAPTEDVPFPTIIAVVTPDDLVSLRKRGAIPVGWDLTYARQCFRNGVGNA